MTTDKDINKFLKTLRHQGWSMTAGKKHIKLYDPYGTQVTVVSRSPSDRKLIRNLRQEISRWTRASSEPLCS